MIRRKFAIFLGVFILMTGIGSFSSYAQSSMTDQQVLDYVKQGVAEGKSQSDMAKELALKGVDRAQAERVRSIYEKEQGTNATGRSEVQDISRVHTVAEDTPLTATTDAAPDQSLGVYGRDLFKKSNLTFAPSENMATPRNYQLGPGDEVIIDIFGANQSTIRSTISPEGSINVDVLGPIYLNGLTIDEANAYLKKRLARIYGGLNRSSVGTDIRLSLGQIRSIQVSILDNVSHPGTYVLSSFSTVFHALYKAGGIVDPGTLRNIKVSRAGRVVGTVDVYDFLTTGSRESDIRLEEGDVILIPPYRSIVKLSGMVKRPMFFEMKEGETLSDVFLYAGGFANGAYTETVTVTRQNGKNFEVRTVPESEFSSFTLKDGDEIEVGKLQSLFENKISVFGSVYRPGTFELGDRIHNVKQLVEVAGGLLPEAFLGRAVIHREHPDKTMEIISVNLGNVLSGRDADVELQNNDALHVASQYDLTDKGTMSISGMVVNPGEYPFAENTTIEDLIILAGGLKNGASTARVDVNRRVNDSDATKAEKSIAKLFSFSLENGLADNGNLGFVLEPYDEVVVHRSPSYNIQKHVTISGEANFAGEYVMSDRDERLSDLIRKAGGVTDFAYVKGARLYRQRSEIEQRQLDDEINSMMVQGDTTSVRLLETSKTYGVAIDLEDAIKNPGGKNDIVLREGDRIEIPVYSNTIRISGAVMMPNAIAYNPSYSAAKYIRLCGGFAPRAKKNHAYVIYMNGAAEPYRASMKLQPGAEIIVPQKGARQQINMAQTLAGLGSTIAGLATMTAAIATMMKYSK